MGGYKDLRVWQLARDIVMEVHKMTLTLPKFEMYEEGAQIRKWNKNVKATMVEGYPEYASYKGTARLSPGTDRTALAGASSRHGGPSFDPLGMVRPPIWIGQRNEGERVRALDLLFIRRSVVGTNRSDRCREYARQAMARFQAAPRAACLVVSPISIPWRASPASASRSCYTRFCCNVLRLIWRKLS